MSSNKIAGMDDELVGQRIGDRYRVLHQIGQGGFGLTYLAVDESVLNKPRCVVKKFALSHQNQKYDKKSSILFDQEAKQLKDLGSHDHIPAYLDYLEDGDNHYLVQEYIDGVNLSQSLKQSGPFSESKIRNLLKSMLSILDFIHSQNVIHRDIKPDNILCRKEDGKLFLVDFGAARYVTGTLLAGYGTTIGSAEFAAPEQLKGQAGTASDLYSLGVTCLHLLTQISPFKLYDIHDDCWCWRDYLLQPISHELGSILDRLTAQSLKHRYQSARQALQDLDHLSQQGENKIHPALKEVVRTQPSTQRTWPESEKQNALPDWMVPQSADAEITHKPKEIELELAVFDNESPLPVLPRREVPQAQNEQGMKGATTTQPSTLANYIALAAAANVLIGFVAIGAMSNWFGQIDLVSESQPARVAVPAPIENPFDVTVTELSGYGNLTGRLSENISQQIPDDRLSVVPVALSQDLDRVVFKPDLELGYGIADSGFYQFEAATGAVSAIPVPSEFPHIEHATAIAHDPTTEQLFFATTGGEGYLYGYSTRSQQWVSANRLSNLDVLAIAHDPISNTLFAAITNSGLELQLVQLSQQGEIIRWLDLDSTIVVGSTDQSAIQMLASESGVLISVGEDLEQLYLADPISGEVSAVN